MGFNLWLSYDPIKTLPPAVPQAYDASMESRIAVLEQIAVSTDKSLREMHEDLREMRQDMKTMLGLGLSATATLLAVLAHGFHWF